MIKFRLYYDISIDEIKEVGKHKINRQLDRINKEWFYETLL